MASMLMLLAAVDEGLGGWFFGITYGERELLDRFDVPAHSDRSGSSGWGSGPRTRSPRDRRTKHRRRPLEEQIHRDSW